MIVSIPQRGSVVIEEVLFAERPLLSFDLARRHNILSISFRICDWILVLREVWVLTVCPSSIRIVLGRTDGRLLNRPTELTSFGSFQCFIDTTGITECQQRDFISSIEQVDILDLSKTNQRIAQLIRIDLCSRCVRLGAPPVRLLTRWERAMCRIPNIPSWFNGPRRVLLNGICVIVNPNSVANRR